MCADSRPAQHKPFTVTLYDLYSLLAMWQGVNDCGALADGGATYWKEPDFWIIAHEPPRIDRYPTRYLCLKFVSQSCQLGGSLHRSVQEWGLGQKTRSECYQGELAWVRVSFPPPSSSFTNIHSCDLSFSCDWQRLCWVEPCCSLRQEEKQ